MDTFDYIIVGLGIALIAIGLLLFISGKRDSQNPNNVEGFGIKLNVSNPSIILIVFGIGLVLFPRLMPNDIPTPTLSETGQVVSQPQDEITQALLKSASNAVDNNDGINTSPSAAQQQTQTAASQFFPQGVWYLTQYEENGADLTNNIQGNIRFSQRSTNSQDWYAEMLAVDAWGNMMNYYYSGIINALPYGYNIDTHTSNDPSFVRQNPSRLTMKMDNPNSLHMEYSFNGSAVLLHWSQ